MARVTTTASSTPCCKNTPDALPAHGQQRRALALAVLATGAGMASVSAAWAQSGEPAASASAPSAVQLQREGGSLLLTASLPWSLPELVLDALLKGIPVHFVAEVNMVRERWYWSDQELLSAQRYMRLSYQPLTRRWRLYTGSQPFEGQGFGAALSSSFESLQEALQAMQRIVRWHIGPAAELPSQGEAVLQLRFRIDISQFPRPLQIGALGRSGWNLLVTHTERVDLGVLQ